MKRKKILSFLIIFFYAFPMLDAVQLYIQNGIQEMMTSKRIHLRIVLDQSEQYIYKDSLRFSIDIPGIELKSWHASVNPTQQYSLLFKRNKLVYPQSFIAEIVFNAEKQFFDEMHEAHMYVAALVYGKDGKNKAYTLMVPLNQPSKLGIHEDQQTTESVVVRDERIEQGEALKAPEVAELGTEFSFFRELFAVWKRLTEPAQQFIGSGKFVVSYILFLALFGLFMLKRRYRWLRYVLPIQGIWEKELRRFSGFVVVGASFYFVTFFAPMYIVLYVFTCYLLIAACYYLKQTPYSETFLGKLKVILGFLLAASMLPTFVKAFLLHSSLFFK